MTEMKSIESRNLHPAMNLRSAPVILDVQHVSVDFVSERQTPAHAVMDLSFMLREGEMLGLVGESGCGKTTLMLSILRLLPAAGRIVSGKIDFFERDLLDLTEAGMNDIRWKNISIIFQGAMNALNPVRTIGDQIKEAIVVHFPRTSKQSLAERIDELLEMVGIGANRKDQYPHQYSGGMRQRAMIAMALACNPQIVIADEPTTALDVMVQAQILELLDNLRHKLGLSVILVTHDLGVVADNDFVFQNAVVADVDSIYNDPRHPYTQQLLKAFPDLSRPKDRLIAIPGYPPQLNALPPGCRFAPRCPQVFERCNIEQPALYQLGPFHQAGCHLLSAS